jgi:hypothetical protein
MYYQSPPNSGTVPADGAEQKIAGMTITPGDAMTATVNFVGVDSGTGQDQFDMQITDETTGKSFDTGVVQRPSDDQRDTAEWIAERPTLGGSASSLANFGEVTFTNASATINGTTGGINTWDSNRINMVVSGVTAASAWGLTDTPPGSPAPATSSFTVQYTANTPASTPVTAQGGFTIGATEGQLSQTQILATFTDPSGSLDPSQYSARVSWGDGSSDDTTTGIIISGPDVNGVYYVMGAHRYAEESGPGNPGSDPYPIDVMIFHDSAPGALAVSSAQVLDPAVVPGSANGTGIVTKTDGTSLLEGQDSGQVVVATFVDPGGAEPLADYSADIYWGDSPNPTSGTISGPVGGVFTVSGDHTYQEETAPSNPYSIRIVIHHDTAPDAAVNDIAAVLDQSVVGLSAHGGTGVVTKADGTNLVENQDSGLVVLATFTDPGGAESRLDYSADINWGDGPSSTQGIISGPVAGLFTVSGDHTYLEESATSNPYAIQVTIHHDTAADTVVNDTAVVADPAVIATAADGGKGIVTKADGTSLLEGQNSGPVVLATFTDPGGAEPLADYSAKISWGDGSNSTLGAISGPVGGVFTVTASHTYKEESGTNPYAIKVVINHGTAPATVVNDTAVVAEQPVVAKGGFPVKAREHRDFGMQTLATFTDPGGAENKREYSATVNWGDGTTSTATISNPNKKGVFTVTADHVYSETNEDRPYTIIVTIKHNGTSVSVTDTTVDTSNGGVKTNAMVASVATPPSASPTASGSSSSTVAAHDAVLAAVQTPPPSTPKAVIAPQAADLLLSTTAKAVVVSVKPKVAPSKSAVPSFS